MAKYTKFHKNGTYKTTDAGALACEAGRYEGFTGLVEWGYTSGMAKDATFALTHWGTESKRVVFYSGEFRGELDLSEVYGGSVAGKVVDCQIYAGKVVEGEIITSERSSAVHVADTVTMDDWTREHATILETDNDGTIPSVQDMATWDSWWPIDEALLEAASHIHPPVVK